MHRALTLSVYSMMVAGGANAQSLEWLTPSDFDLTCPIFKKCVVEAACVPHADELTIRHNPSEGATVFNLPENVTSTGVLGMVSGAQGQTIMASASANGQQYFRMMVFPTGAITVAKLNLSDNKQDTIFYGSCKQVVG